MPVGYTQHINAQGTNGNRTAVLMDIKTKIYGLKADGKDFPTCSLNKIATAKNDTVCPKGATAGDRLHHRRRRRAAQLHAAGSACDPLLHVWNSGQGKLTFFFVDTPTHQCLGGALKTGSTGPYPATYKTQGKYLVVDVPDSAPTSTSRPRPRGLAQERAPGVGEDDQKVKGKTVAMTRPSVAWARSARTRRRSRPTCRRRDRPRPTTVPGTAPC